MAEPLSDAETLKIDSQGMIAELGKKPQSYDEIQGQYIGLIKVRYDRVAELCHLYDAMDPERIYDGRTRKQMYLTSFVQHAIDNGWPVQAVPVNNGWLEVDTLDELQLYRMMMAEGTLDGFFRIARFSSGSAGSSVES